MSEILLRMSIARRMAVTFCAVTLLGCSALGVLLWRLQGAADATEKILNHHLAVERVVTDWYQLVHSAMRRVTAIVVANGPELSQYFAEENKTSASAATALQKKADALLTGEDERRLLAEIATWRGRYVSARDAIYQAKKDGRVDEAARLFQADYVPASKAYVDQLQALLALQRAQIDRAGQAIAADHARIRWLLPTLAFGLLLGGAVFAGLLTRSITRPLKQAVQVADRIAAGDLTMTLDPHGNDELAHLLEAMQRMQQGLSSTIDGIRRSTEHISHASSEIAAGNQDLSTRTEHTAANLQKTAGSMEEINASVRHTADASRQADALAATAVSHAARGGEVVAQVVRTMDEISSASRRIADIIGVIDSIAFQTNILALNAAVEAARAGEQGRGFAVVAGEVRSLAQRSAQAAQEIKALIHDSEQKVESGSALVNSAGQTMADIVSSVEQVTTVIAEINSASTQESNGIAHIHSAVGELDQMTQQNAALVEENAAAAASLKDQTRALAESVHGFKL